MSLTGDVEIQIIDGGGAVVSVPASSVQVVIGACSSGAAAQVVASRDPNALKAAVGSGPGVEAAATIIAAGGTALFMKAATATPGVASAVTQTGGGAVIGVSGEPLDAYLVKILWTKAGTVGTDGGRFKLSLDAGRTYGPDIALGDADTYLIPGTGLTLSFAAGNLAVGDTATFGCTEPLTDTAGVEACLVALEASPFSTSGWGSMHITGPWTGAEAATIQGFLDTMVTTKTWTRTILTIRDADLPEVYGGIGESEADWISAILLDVSALSAKRVCMCAGHYNIPSLFATSIAGLPRYRRPGAWALAARQVSFGGTVRGGPQTHAGRVSDGALAQIVVDPTNDPSDGFIYHNELSSPALDDARFCSFTRRKGKGGFFVRNPNLMSPTGSSFKLLPHGLVMDIGCSLEHQVMEEQVNSDVRTNDNGTIDEIAAQGIELVMRGALRDQMLAKGMISGFTFTIDRTNNVLATSIVKYSSELRSRAYVLQIDGSIGFGNAVGG
jgi:hypothetical protein